VKTFTRILGGSVLIILLGITALFILHPRIPLSALTRPVSSLLTKLTGKEQMISGRYFIVPGAWTTFSIEEGSLLLSGKKDFRLQAAIASAQTTVHLWSLIKRQIKLDGLTVHGTTLDVATGVTEGGSDKKHDVSTTEGFIPFTLKQTGIIDLTKISAKISTKGSKPQISFLLEEGKGGFDEKTPLQFTLRAILDNRRFDLAIQGGSFAGLANLDTKWPISVHMEHKSVVADVHGFVAKDEKGPELTAEFSLSGKHFDDLVSILGRHGSTDQPFALTGKAVLSQEEIQGDFSRVQLGSENLSLSISVKKDHARKPQYACAIQDNHLDVDALKGFFSQKREKDENRSGKPEKIKIDRDDIIFPSSLPIRNLNLDLDVKELVMAGHSAKDVRLKAVMIDGNINNSPFAATFKNADLKGLFSLKTETEIPALSIHYDADSLDIGAFLKDFKLADDIVMRVEKTAADLDTKGRTLGELLANLKFVIHAENGEYIYRERNTEAILPVYLEKTEFAGLPGGKITATVQGRIDKSPIAIDMELVNRLAEAQGSVTNIPVVLDIRVAGTQWKLSGKIPLPFRMEGIVLNSRLNGGNLSSLNELLHIHLPALGPYEIAGDLNIVPEGYSIEGIQVRVGSSKMKGNASINTSARPPEVKIGLKAERIQMDDFSALQSKSSKKTGSALEANKMNDIATGEKKLLTDQKVLDLYNASVELEVNEVLSGKDYLGSGLLKIDQQDGRLQVLPLEIKLPEGTVKVDLSMSPSGNERLYNVHMNIENLDYGFVARHFKPDTDMSGIINLRGELKSVSPDSQGILPNGYGYLDFCIQPKKLRAGVIDLWAVNLFSYLVPFLLPKEGSTIHCAAGRFNLDDGMLRQDDFFIDTSQIRVKGKVEVDFKKETIDAILKPIPKRPQFYSLSTPIEVKGNLSDLKTKIAAGGVAKTIIHLATSSVVVPLQWLTRNKLPEDGTADCRRLMEERKK